MHIAIPGGFLVAAACLNMPILGRAQQVWQVANQQQLNAAIAAAAPGDIVRLAANGTFDRFRLTRV